jgi:HEAT repeats
MSAVESLRPLLFELESALSTSGPDAIWDCEPLIRAFDQRGGFVDVINTDLQRLVDQPEELPMAVLPLASDDYCKLSLITLGNEALAHRAPVLRDFPENGLIYVVGPESLTFEVYEQSGVENYDVFDRAKVLDRVGRKTLLPGQALRIEAGKTIVDFPESHPMTVVVSLHGPPLHAISWAYDRVTLLPVHPYSASIAATRIEYALTILGEVGRFSADASVETAQDLLSHPSYFVRWRACHALNALSPKAAESALLALSQDVHPHIRNAAQRTLASARAET